MSRELAEEIAVTARTIGRPLKLMEVCGTHTVSIFRHGIRGILPGSISLLSGPGCPVCVTSAGDVEAAMELANQKGVSLATFGDMMRVPGEKESLQEARAKGAAVDIVYSPLDALKAASEGKEEVVFFATGFETTSPLVAATLHEAEKRGVANFSILSVHKLVPPALSALLSGGEVEVDGFILPGHVCTVTGSLPYRFLGEDHHKPAVVTGFEAGDILEGILMLARQIAAGEAKVQIQYTSVVREEGNPRAQALLDRFFEPEDALWRGIGVIPGSGLGLRDAFRHRDAAEKFGIERKTIDEPKACRCGDVLKGIKLPPECPLFGKVCTPEKPVGACMVSTEGSCAAYFKYGGGTSGGK
jgi:hydrogenase expression/formation protein HypD